MAYTFDRRSFLRYSMIAGGAVGSASVLAACSSGSSDSGGASATNPKVQLSWQKNIEFAGEYFALENGYYEAAGLGTPELITGGGPGTGVETGLTSNKVWIGMTAPQLTAPVILQGAALKTIAATFQKNPFCIVSGAQTPILSPQEMKGKKIGVQASNENVFKALLTANGMVESDVQKITVQYDPTPLTTGEVDGWVSYVTNEPITLAEGGFPNANFLFADFNLPLVAETLVVRQETIDNERDKLKAFLKADIQGWYDAVADPAKSAELAVTKYGKDLGLELGEQTKEAEAQNLLIVNDDSKANGLLTITPALIDLNIEALAKAGYEITAEQLFDMSLIQEVYAENPDLKKAI
ncbi:ABC transporter substrate-binding protein [Williamsia sp. 1138]|jgi:ABC-type nitrate/sulfonate/bicarbonate transport system substrate-binding protein|uniref:ABC transporter substrate-binding protein n=1 Tax=Gordonia rubripertincta TaxID=36822 RepID=A0ABT4N2N8_GORRU|nr:MULTISPECIES: ABC transporter substrate-binding protein [Mycobacteriales]MCZ4553521.1 ABC transporter substrate-binding protein [Gordonia rubripertincta]OZG29623.1 ABC transporter substrate-binding protein [Williamsia sp. 1138]